MRGTIRRLLRGPRDADRPPAAAARSTTPSGSGSRRRCWRRGPGRDRRHRRLGHARRRAHHAPRRHVHRLGPERLRGRARLRGVLRPLDQPLLGRGMTPDMAAELRALAARQCAERESPAQPWGWKEPRSVYLLPFLARAPAEPPLPARRPRRARHGVLVEPDAAPQARRGDPRRRATSPQPLRSIALWSDVNLRGGRLRRAASSATATCACASRISAATRSPASRRSSGSSGSRATPSAIAAEEVQAPVDVRALARRGSGARARR